MLCILAHSESELEELEELLESLSEAEEEEAVLCLLRRFPFLLDFLRFLLRFFFSFFRRPVYFVKTAMACSTVSIALTSAPTSASISKGIQLEIGSASAKQRAIPRVQCA